MTYWPYALAVAVGAGLTVQIGMNAAVGRAFGSPLAASILNFGVGLAALAIAAFATGIRFAPASFAVVPGWAWLGGLLGAAYVVSTTVLGPRLGAAVALALALAGQMIAALLVDHYGAIGFPKHPVTWERIAGIALLLLGVWMIMRR